MDLIIDGKNIGCYTDEEIEDFLSISNISKTELCTIIKQLRQLDNNYTKLKQEKELFEHTMKSVLQCLWNETHNTKTNFWSPHIFAQNMLIRYFGFTEFDKITKMRKHTQDNTLYLGDAVDMFLTKQEQDIRCYEKQISQAKDTLYCLIEKIQYEEINKENTVKQLEEIFESLEVIK